MVTTAQTSYRENDVRGASPVRLVILLYDQIIQDLTQAARAIDQNEIALRTQLINHAILVIGHLQSPLDFEKGGQVAKNLEHFYNVLRQSLVQLQFMPSKTGMDQIVRDVLEVRESWVEVARAEQTRVDSAGVAASASCPADALEHSSMDWKG